MRVKSEVRRLASAFDNPHGLMAFIASWLARFILSMSPEDGINAVIFPLTIKLVEGHSLQLAPLFLGSLYHKLDCLQDEAKHSSDICNLSSYLCTPFLTLFFFNNSPVSLLNQLPLSRP